MKAGIVAVIFAILVLPKPVFAHRLDEYLQATIVSIEKDHVAVQMRLTPGVAVFEKVIAAIDTDANETISDSEQAAYAEQVRRDLSLTIEGHPSQLQLLSSTFPPVDQMKQGLGDILLDFKADVPAGGTNRRLILENHHQSRISVYLVNCLSPSDPDIHITNQDRNYDQSFYQLDYTQTGVISNSLVADGRSGVSDWLDKTGSRSLFKAYVYQGIHHILTGYDHLLFVSALVLAATTLWDVVKVVFAFTLAHSITLTLAALNMIHLSERVVEPMIAASIVFVAIQNVFWPRRARGWTRLFAAFLFGLFHGLGFAGGLLDAMRQMPNATMLLAILAFSIGVETGHQMVVLPLFTLLKTARQVKSDVVARTHLSMAFQRIGSAGISMAGVYYLWIALGCRL
ncbi:MAG TPA: HupE/UreJ family protein [Tepidisphaeraceae bacterium]|jgi:hypothetical protein|nr:HupE/UreJ family protein [Tepidisphaeraceae bacterium]